MLRTSIGKTVKLYFQSKFSLLSRIVIPKTQSSLGLLNYVLKLFWVGEAFLAQTNTYRTKICLSTLKIRLTMRNSHIQPTVVN